jgi:uncharacterized membrane protein
MEGPRQVPAGIFSRNVSRTIFTHLECAKRQQQQIHQELVRSSVRTIGTRPPMRTRTKFALGFALLVRTH